MSQMKGFVFLVPIVVLILTAITGVGLYMWVSAVINVLSIVTVIILFPFLLKIISDYVLALKLGLYKWVSLLIGSIASFIIVYALYLNFTWLVVGSIIIFVIYMALRWGLGNEGKNAMSLAKWFV